MSATQFLMGFIAGATILIGLPVARLRKVSDKTKGLLNAISTGILIFLLVEIAGHVLEEIEELIGRAASGQPGFQEALSQGGLFALGFSIGLLGLVYFERRWVGSAKDVVPQRRAKQVATMIALGLGLHNFSEGLAIGQGFASGAFELAWLLVIGFALHNATEGFGIAAPLSGERVSWIFLIRLALIAGGPTMAGVFVGGWWANKSIEVFCLALAAGTILYVVGELLHLGRQLKEESVVAIGLLAGFFIAVLTDFVLVGAMHRGPVTADASPAVEVSASPVGEAYHKPRHGGIFGDADDIYHYEVLLNGEQLVLYVNDDYNRPLNVQGLQGRWKLNPDSGAPVTGDFAPSPDGAFFVADLPKSKANPVHIEVAVLKGRIWAPLEFFVPRSS